MSRYNNASKNQQHNSLVSFLQKKNYRLRKENEKKSEIIEQLKERILELCDENKNLKQVIV